MIQSSAKKGKPAITYAIPNQIDKGVTKAKFLQNLQDAIMAHSVKGLFHVQLDHNIATQYLMINKSSIFIS